MERAERNLTLVVERAESTRRSPKAWRDLTQCRWLLYLLQSSGVTSWALSWQSGGKKLQGEWRSTWLQQMPLEEEAQESLRRESGLGGKMALISLWINFCYTTEDDGDDDHLLHNPIYVYLEPNLIQFSSPGGMCLLNAKESVKPTVLKGVYSQV